MKKFENYETINHANHAETLITASTTTCFVKVWRSEDRRILFVLEWQSDHKTAVMRVLPTFRCGASMWVTPEVSKDIALSIPGKRYPYPGLAEKEAMRLVDTLERRDRMGRHTYSMTVPTHHGRRDRIVADICETHRGVSQIGNGASGVDRLSAAISTRRVGKCGGKTFAQDLNPNNDRGCVRVMGYREFVGNLLGE